MNTFLPLEIKTRAEEIFSKDIDINQIIFKRLVDSGAPYQEEHSNVIEELFRNNIIIYNRCLDITSGILPMPISADMEIFVATRKL